MTSVQCAHILGRTGNQCKKHTKVGRYCHLHTNEHVNEVPKKAAAKADVAGAKATARADVAKAKAAARADVVAKAKVPKGTVKNKTVPVMVKKTEKIDTCPICLDDNVSLKLFSCGHGACDECRPKLRQDICFICRKDIKADLKPIEKKAIEKRLAQDVHVSQREHIMADQLYAINIIINDVMRVRGRFRGIGRVVVH